MIGKTISHYKIISKIGEGGRGIVYKATDTDLNRIVALKFISPHLADNSSDLKSLYDEARSASQLNHPNITTIYEIGHSGKFYFIAMEYMDGTNLKEKIKNEALSEEEIIKIAISVLKGIEVAHQNNIIHRDIKSENIMITKSGTAKVMDFGLAKNLDKQNVTKVSKTLGTIAYMSPEQIEGSKVDQRSDIYSFGVVLYEMLTGRLPFVGEHEASTLYSIVNEPASDILSVNSNADKNLIAIIEKAIEKKPDDRYQNATLLMDDLNELKTGSFIPIVKRVARSSIISNNIRSKWLIGGVAGLLLLFSSLFIFLRGDNTNNANFINSLAVLNFDNIQDPEDPNRLGQILQELIIADLSEIPNLKVYSSQRLFDIQKQFGSDNRKSIDPALASDIAQEAGAETMLTGNIITRGTNLILSSQLITTKDGSIIKSHQVAGNDIYVMVDELTLQIQSEMNISTEKGEPIDVAVADKTTFSVNAFQYYFNGIDYFNDSHFTEAIIEFKNAISIDSTFSNAYYKLALAQWWSQSEMDNESIKNAQESLQKILNGSWYRTTKEKLLAQGALELTNQNFIKAEEVYLQLIDFISDEKEAWYGLGEAYFHGSQDFRKASDAFERAVELDPEFTIAYRHIFDIYSQKEEYDSGIIRATQLIDRNPEEVWGHIFLGQMLIGKKDYIQAKKVFEDALKIDMDLKIIYKYLSHIFSEEKLFEDGIIFAESLLNSNNKKPQVYDLLAHMYIGKNDLNKTIQTYETALRYNPNSYQLFLSLAHVYQLNGQYMQTINQYDEIENKFPEFWNSNSKYQVTNVYLEQGRYKDAISVISDGLEQLDDSDANVKADLLNSWAYFAYLIGDFNTAQDKIDQALLISESSKNQLISKLIESFILFEQKNIRGLEEISNNVNKINNSQKDDALGNIINDALKLITFFAKGDHNSVVTIFNEMDEKVSLKNRFYYFVVLSYIELVQYTQAMDVVNDMRNYAIPIGDRAFTYPRSYYLEGIINENQGNTQEAKQNYQRLLNIWKDGNKESIDYQKVLVKYNSL